MKKLFTLFAFLAMFMGAKAEWVQDYAIDYTTHTGFPFYVMGYVPEWVDGIMTDYGSDYRYATQDALDGDGDDKWKDGESSVGSTKTEGGVEYQKVTGAGPYWHQYFIADGIPTELDGSYTVKALVKASAEVTINVNMGWGWGSGQQKGASVKIPASDDFVEVEWEYSEIGGASCNLVAQPGTATAVIEWKSLTVSHNQKAQRPTIWQQWLTNDGKSIIPNVATESKYMGDAEFGAWPAWSLEETDGVNINWRGERTGEICAWALTMGKNYQESVINNDSPRARPFPADIEAEKGNESNHIFAIHVDQIGVIDAPEPDDNSIQWSNQFWIQSPQGWKSGTQIRIKFRYKADKAAKTSTQIHKQNPSNYLHWDAVGDVNFTTEWQEFDKTITFNDSQATGWSLAFNLCAESTKDAPQEPNVFYFDDLSWETMVLDEGLFIASANTVSGLVEYDFDNATEFTQDPEDDEVVFAIVGEEGKQDTWVNEVMISTVRGNDAAFKGNTIKPSFTIADGEWGGYESASMAKIKLPAAGVWKIEIASGTNEICFTKLEGEEAAVPVDIVTNTTEMVIKATEREDLKDNVNNGAIEVREEADDPNGVETGGAGHEGQTWDNQFWIAANRDLALGEETVIEFDYVATKEAKTSTQDHKVGDDGKPCTYLYWDAIGDVTFTTEIQHFYKEFTVSKSDWGSADGMRSLVFNMSEIKEACDYTIMNVKWYLKGSENADGKTMENLINATGTDNFWVKIDKSAPYKYGEESGINSVVNNNAVPTVTYNLAGQRVANEYKGIVIKNGKKKIVK